MSEHTDVIDQILDIHAGSALDHLRSQRPLVRKESQASFSVLFGNDSNGLTAFEREALAVRVSALHQSTRALAFYRKRLTSLGATEENANAIEKGEAPGQPRLAALLDHAGLLTLDPASGSKDHLAELFSVGLSPAEVISVSQLIAFLSYQIRVEHGLNLLEVSR